VNGHVVSSNPGASHTIVVVAAIVLDNIIFSGYACILLVFKTGTLHSVIKYGLPLSFCLLYHCANEAYCDIMLQTNRTAFQCLQRYQTKLNPCLQTGYVRVLLPASVLSSVLATMMLFVYIIWPCVDGKSVGCLV